MPACRRLLSLALAGLLAAGCTGTPAQPPTPTGPKRSATPRPDRSSVIDASPAPVASTGVLPTGEQGIAYLTGKVKLISDHGGGIISNNGGALISNNGGALVSNNGGGVIANNGAGYRLKQAATAESLLADAEIAFFDAAGKAIPGPDGKPLTARTDQTGGYALRTPPPAGNMVLKVKLWNGGELQALLAGKADRATALDVDTASSLGAAFVLGELVKGDQATFDKLPAAEAARLSRELEASRALLAAPPSYQPAALASAAAELRAKAPAVDAALEAIEALLLGQKKLGDGTPATGVPLNRPYGVEVEADGSFMIAEAGLGRLRRVSPDGLISTYADGVRGVVKRNFVGVRDLHRLADGSLLLSCLAGNVVFRIKPDDTVQELAKLPFGPLGASYGADGTLYVVGKGAHPENGLRAPAWAAVSPDGAVRTLPIPGPGGNGVINAVEPAPGGGLYVMQTNDAPNGTAVYLVGPDGTSKVVADGFSSGEDQDLRVAPDGTIYLSHYAGVDAIAPDGTRRKVAGPDVAGAPAMDEAAGLGVGPDGTLYVSDIGTARIFARDPQGAWRAVAGVDADAPLPDGNALPLNTPSGLAFDAQGRLLISENGRHRVVRYAGGRLETVAGAGEGFGGDGGPATGANFSGLTGIATKGDELYIVDAINGLLRHVDAGGIVNTLAGIQLAPVVPDQPSYKPAEITLKNGLGIAVGPDGRPYWANSRYQQIHRLGAPDRLDVVVGARPDFAKPAGFLDAVADVLTDGEPAAKAVLRTPTGIAFDPKGDLYIADAAHFQVRRVTGLATDAPTIEGWVGRGPATFTSILGSPDAAGRNGDRREIDLVIPGGLCFDPQGNMYVGEMGTRRLDFLGDLVGAGVDPSAFPPIPPRVRKVTPDGKVTTIVGPGGTFFTDPDAEDALIMPTAIAFAPDGRLVIADPGANLVRILPAGSF